MATSESPQKKIRNRKKRERKRARLTRKLKRKRTDRIKKLTESNPDLTKMEIDCKTKKGFATRQEAMLDKPSGLYVYECPVCIGFHFTSQKQAG